MIVIDTSAILAVVFREPRADECLQAIAANSSIWISAGTLAELRVVAAGRERSVEVEAFLNQLDLEVANVDAETAAAVGPAYARWGKGFHPAKLNFGDCFAYVLAKRRDCPLLFIGNDFSLTDVTPALR